MTRLLQYNEPPNITVVVTEAEAIQQMKKLYHYDDDHQALLDFISLHWATYTTTA